MAIERQTDPSSELQKKVEAELHWDARVSNATTIGIAVNHGTVTLSGQVGTFAEKMAAQEAAHRVSGVEDVANDITVVYPGNTSSTDTDIAMMVRCALDWNTLIPRHSIRSTVADGWVTLDGMVERWSNRFDAATAISHLHGVRGVTNNITVVPKVAEPDQNEIRGSIEAALERQAMRESNRLSVRVQDGTVTLTGKVRSWPEKLAAAGAAGFAPGVHHVNNLLTVDPYI